MFKNSLKVAALATAMAIALVGCASTGASTAAGGKSLKDCTITMIPKATNNPYFAAVKTGLVQAQKQIGGKLNYVGDQAGITADQISLIQSASQRHSCAIGIAALDATALVPSLKAAAKAGTKVVTWDSDVTPTGRGIFVNMATAKGLGDTQFGLLAKAMNNEGQWAIISSQANATSKNLWITYMNKMAKDPKYSKMSLVKTTFGNDDAKTSYDLAVSLIRAYPDLKGIMAPTPVALEASVKAIYDLGVEKQIVVTGLGNPGNDSELLTSGKVASYVLWSPVDLGYLSYYATAAYVEGKITGKKGDTFSAGRLGKFTVGAQGEVILGDPKVFTKDNVEASIAKDFKATN